MQVYSRVETSLVLT